MSRAEGMSLRWGASNLDLVESLEYLMSVGKTIQKYAEVSVPHSNVAVFNTPCRFSSAPHIRST